MNSRREHRTKVYNNLYKQYLRLMKKTGDQRTRNKLLHSTNNELSKEIIRMKDEIRKSLSKNSNLKVEIHDLTVDQQHLMDDSKGLYNTLTTLHKDTLVFEKRISQLLNSLDPEIKSFEVEKRTEIKNPKDIHQQLPETSYHRYNFKDFIYIQDLSPIMEENVEINKKLIKPLDVIRRLGHRAKVPNTDKCNQNIEVNGLEFDEGPENGAVSDSPTPIQDPYKEIEIQGKQSVIVEEGTILNVVSVRSAKELLSLPSDCNESNNMSVDESILSSTLTNHSQSQHKSILKNESYDASPLPIIDVIPPSDSENTLNEKDFHSALFANVFPRRRMVNNRCSFRPGSVEDEGDEEQNNMSIGKENLSPSISMNSLKNDLDHSIIRSDSFVEQNITTSHESIRDLTSEMSHQEESIIENSCSDPQHDMKTVTTDVNARDESNLEISILSESQEGQSADGKLLESSSKSAEDKTMDEREISDSSFKKMTDDSNVGHSTMKSSSQILSQGSNAEGRKSLPKPCSKKSSLSTTCNSTIEKKNEAKPLLTTVDRNSVKSSKHVSPAGRKSMEDSKKSLRPKKPLNFAESPVVKSNQKRKRKLEKPVK